MQADWDDLRVFLTLAREGSLTAAARRLEVSHPTVARRVRSLEETLGARLFDRLPDRFALTAAGEELLTDAEAMELAAESIRRRSAGLGDTTYGTVRISASEAMSAFLARQLPALRHNLQCVEIELATNHLMVNLSRREADLLIREEVPDVADIVTRRLGRVAYAVYGSPSLVPSSLSTEALRELPWVGFDDDHAYMPGQAWIRDLLRNARPVLRVNNWLVMQEILRTGSGVSVLPCYLGDADPMLSRAGGVLNEVAADQWLLVHRDLRALHRVRAIMDRLIALFETERPLIEGKAARRRAPPLSPRRAAAAAS